MVQSCGWLLCMIASAVAAAKSSGMLMTSSTCCAGATYCMLPHHLLLSGKSTCAVSIKHNIWQECSPTSCAPSSGVPKARACARLMAATEAWSGSGFDMLGRNLDLIALISAPCPRRKKSRSICQETDNGSLVSVGYHCIVRWLCVGFYAQDP